jgi:hypothetical protein
LQQWFLQNWLALLGAVTGSLALLVNFLSYRHNHNKDQVQLTVSVRAHPEQDKNARALLESEDKQPWERQNLVEVYCVTVRNTGNIEAPLSSVGVVDASGVDRTAMVRHGQFLHVATASSMAPVPAKSEQQFVVYLNRGESLYTAVRAFVVDQTGKRWQSNV